jgi:hypothetical protein
VQTATFKEAVTGIKMAIIQMRYPEEIIYQSQTVISQQKLLIAVDANIAGRFPHNFYTPNLHREYFGSPAQMNQKRIV